LQGSTPWAVAHGSAHIPLVAPCEVTAQTASPEHGVDWLQVSQVPPGSVTGEQVPGSGKQAEPGLLLLSVYCWQV